jgi:hypothetical protein
MLMLICREYHNFLREFDKFLSWQDMWQWANFLWVGREGRLAGRLT